MWIRLFFNLMLISTLIQPAFAGTYNFYFNNTEQGDNSTSTPMVTIKDGKDGKEAKPADPNEQEQQPTPPAKESPQSEPEEAPKPKPALKKESALDSTRKIFFRVIGGAQYRDVTSTVPKSIFEADFGSPFWEQTKEQRDTGMGVFFAGAMFFGKQFGINLNLGSVSSIEGEFSPVGLGGLFFEPAILGGYSSTSGLDSFHVGARVSFNMGDVFGLSFAGRSNFGSKDAKFYSVDGGLAFRF